MKKASALVASPQGGCGPLRCGHYGMNRIHSASRCLHSVRSIHSHVALHSKGSMRRDPQGLGKELGTKLGRPLGYNIIAPRP